jgi:predicted metal-dependent hydrolase
LLAGDASAIRLLNFNDALMKISKDFGDYVIVHELLYFQVPNHEKLWKSLMRVYLGNGKKQKAN